MVVLEAFSVDMLPAAQRSLMVSALLLLCGLAGGVDHTEGKAHQQWPDHSVNKREEKIVERHNKPTTVLFTIQHCLRV